MAFNGSGTHVRVHDWTTDLTNTVPVTASRMDAEHDDISTALSTTICRDGQSTTTARIPFAAGLSAAAGTTASVSYAQTNDNNTGLYFPASDQWGLVAGGTATLTSTSAAVTVTATLTVTGAVDFGAAVLPTSSDGGALGSATKMWSDLFLASGAVINWNNGDVTAAHSANALAFAGASSGYSFDAVVTVSSGGITVTGNSTVTGTLTVTSALNGQGAANITGDVAVNTNKFTIAAASGNTAVAGNLTVTGSTTSTGALAANNSAGITGRNTAKAFCSFTTDGTPVITGLGTLFNVTSVATATVNGQNGFRITFATAMSTANYTALITAQSNSAVTSAMVIGRLASGQTTTTLDFIVISSPGNSVTRTNLFVQCSVFENE